MLKSRNKGQVYGQVFVYILMLVVFGSVLVYGVYAIGQIIDRAEKVEIEKFKIDVKNFITDNREFGSVDVIELRLPGDYLQLCFAEPRATKVYLHGYSSDEHRIPAIENLIASGTTENMFLYPPGTEATHVGPLRTEKLTGSQCFEADSRGIVKVKLEGFGDKTEVSYP